jgi:general secretion pathway protein L
MVIQNDKRTMTRIELILSEPHLAWAHLDDGDVIARGESDTLGARDPERTRVFIPPANSVILTAIELEDLAPAQARAAARMAVAEKSLLDAEDLYVDCTRNGLMAASVSAGNLIQWVATYDPDVILPGPLLLPSSDGVTVGSIREWKLARGPAFAGEWDDVITPLVIGDRQVKTLSAAEFDAAMANAIADPEINLRAYEFERREQWSVDHHTVRTFGWLAAALLIVTLLIPLITSVRLNRQSDNLEATARAAAQAAVGSSVPEDQAITQLDGRLAALRGGGAGFSKTSAAVNLAVQATPNVELTAMTFAATGELTARVRATKNEEIDLLSARMRALGLKVDRGPLNPAQGQPVIELKVRGL